MISTRKVNNFEIKDKCIVCDCGVSVKKLSRAAIELGIKGFEGLIDLPGTIASALYGHASCFGYDVSDLLVEALVLTPDGNTKVVDSEWFGFQRRSSALKRGEKSGVILTVILSRKNEEPLKLKEKAEHIHNIRKASQPEARNSLGSIFKEQGRPTLLNCCLAVVGKTYAILLQLLGYSNDTIARKRKHLVFSLIGGKDILPYVIHWNWYQWKDEKSHELFWKYVKLHRLMFTKTDFEIEIKHNKQFKIP